MVDGVSAIMQISIQQGYYTRCWTIGEADLLLSDLLFHMNATGAADKSASAGFTPKIFQRICSMKDKITNDRFPVKSAFSRSCERQRGSWSSIKTRPPEHVCERALVLQRMKRMSPDICTDVD